jgi:hypothetical protein
MNSTPRSGRPPRTRPGSRASHRPCAAPWRSRPAGRRQRRRRPAAAPRSPGSSGPQLSAGRGRGRRQAGWDRCAGPSSRPRPRSWQRRGALTERSGFVIAGTIRVDGTPRISPVAAHLVSSDLMLVMIPGTHKARDVLRDHRIVLQSPVRHGDGLSREAQGTSQGRPQSKPPARTGRCPRPRSGPGWRAAAGIRPVSALDPVHRVSRRVGIRWAVAVAGCLFNAARKGPSADQSCVHIGGSWSAFAFTVSDLHAGILVPGQAAAVSR